MFARHVCIQVLMYLSCCRPAPAAAETLCSLRVPDAARADPGIWRRGDTPLDDALDRFVLNRTGCAEMALKHDFSHDFLDPVVYDGAFLWRVAVRARDDAALSVWWGSSEGYNIHIGDENNARTRIQRFETNREWTRRTPAVLAEDRHVPFYVRIQRGKLTFGSECEPEPLFSLDVSVAAGDELRTRFWAFSPFGAKYLHGCPDVWPRAATA